MGEIKREVFMKDCQRRVQHKTLHTVTQPKNSDGFVVHRLAFIELLLHAMTSDAERQNHLAP